MVAVVAAVIGIVAVLVVIGVGAAAHTKDRDGERQRHQSRPQPVRMLHGGAFSGEVAFRYHNCVFDLPRVRGG